MRPNFYLSPVVLALGISNAANAAQPVALDSVKFNLLKQQFHLHLPGTALRGPIPADALKFVSQHLDQNKVSHVRLQQMYAGFPVFGGYAIVHSPHSAQQLLSADQAAKMNGTVFQGLAADLGQPADDFVAQGQKALAHFAAQYRGQDTLDAKVEPMVYLDENNQAHWAYQVSLQVRYRDKIPAQPSAIVDAKTFKPFVAWNDMKTERQQVKGQGFGGNQKMGEYVFGKDLPLLEMTRDDLTGSCFMETKAVKVVDMQHTYSSKSAPMEFKCPIPDTTQTELVFWTGYQADGYDKDNGAASPTNDALYAGYVIKHMYKDWYKVEALTTSTGEPMQLVMRVHYGRGYENAYWDGKQMTFGDGDTMMYPLVSLGVGAHEISHGFTEQHSGLRYFGQSGGMNEAFSDMAAQAAEYYSTSVASWMIGSEIMKEDSGWEALRFMDTPSRDGRSIDKADQYYGGLDVHYSSGVFNRLYYLMATSPDWTARKAFDVMVKANMDYWTPYSNFKDGGCGVLKATRDLGYSISDVKAALDKVAVDYKACVLE